MWNVQEMWSGIWKARNMIPQVIFNTEEMIDNK
jgi:hypothetical protein